MPIHEEQIAQTLYYDRTFEVDAAKISPGEFYYTDKDMVIVTVLGSCISACIRDTVAGVGGMNHFMLPESASADKDSPISESMRYGSYAMEVLINQLLTHGARRENLEAKIFGGGAVIKSMSSTHVGERNAKFVKGFLRDEGIKVIGEDLLDVFPRKVYYFPKTGRALVKKLRELSNDTVVKREEAYASKINTNEVAGEVDLF